MVGSSQWRCRPTSISRPPSAARQPQEQDLARARAWLRPRLGQRVQHVLPGRERRPARGGSASGRRLDAVARGGVHVVRLLVEAGRAAVRAAWRSVRRCAPGRGRAAPRLPRRRDRAGTRRIPPRRGNGLVLATVRASTWWRISRRNASVGLGRPVTLSRERRFGMVVSPSRLCQPGAGSARAAWSAASSGVSSIGRAATSSSMRRFRPRARDRPPSAPSSQRRNSAVSRPDSSAENALSAASNTWWPSSNT